MKIDRTELVDLIKNKVFQTSNVVGFEKIKEELTAEGKFDFIEFQNLKNESTELESLNNAEIYWIIESASKHIKSIQSPEFYFDSAEIENARFYNREAIEKVEYPIVFENVEDLAPNENRQFGFYLTVKQIAMLKRNSILEVIPNLQRGGKKNKYGDLIIDTNPKRHRAIRKVIESGRYFFDQIRINLMNDENSNFEYDLSARTLTINSGTMIIPDGNHRTIACESVETENVNANNKFSVAFTFLTAQQTQALLDQTWNMEKIKGRKKKSMEITKSNLLLDAVLRSQDADTLYKDNVVKGNMGKNYQNGFILYDVLSQAIRKFYNAEKIESQLERNLLAKWLVEFFNVLTSILIEDFKNYKESNKTRWAANPYTFIGYVLISSHLKEQDDWQNKLKEMIDSIDFSNDNSPLKNQVVKSKEKSIEIYFREVIENAKII